MPNRPKPQPIRRGIIVQARLGSIRLPGKVLLPIRCKPMIEYLLLTLRRLDLPMIVATSDDHSDDAIAAYCDERRISHHRGSLDDVAGRFLSAARQFELDAFVRVSGDSPLLQPEVVEQAIQLFDLATVDLVTNVAVRSFPKGQSVEVVRFESFAQAYEQMSDPQDREHVTRYFYRHAENWRIRDFRFDPPCGDIQLSVDTRDDQNVIAGMIEMMDRPHWSYGVRGLLALRERMLEGLH